MKKIKKGDIVVSNIYDNNILFRVESLSTINSEKTAMLKGILDRIQLETTINKIDKISGKEIKDIVRIRRNREIEKIYNLEIEKNSNFKNKSLEGYSRNVENLVPGKILHVDGDRKYSEKSNKYYKKLGLDAIVKNVPEYLQPNIIYELLKKYEPDVLIITGHDGMIRKGTRYNDINNYRNSKYFIETVKEARKYDEGKEDKIAIFAGACQSYFEELILAGANFASSPGRILIDFVDPILVAKKIALTDEKEFIGIEEIEGELKEGKKGIDGIGSNGKMKKI